MEAKALRRALSPLRPEALPGTWPASDHRAASAPKAFHERTLWPEFVALCDELHTHLEELTTRVIREAIDEDVSEPAEQTAPPKALPEASRR